MKPEIPYRCYIGFDADQLRAWNVAVFSLRAQAKIPLAVQRIAMQRLRTMGLYTRPTKQLERGYWDEISGAPMSTSHAIARFFVPILCEYEGWALFTDGDVLFRHDVGELFSLADDRYAIQVVPHSHQPPATIKMTGEQQTLYARKNWSSVILWNCAHPANRNLTVELCNTVPGRDLHRFCWLSDDLIGRLPARWNVLVGSEIVDDPALVHFTEGIPDMPGYEHVDYADEWYATARGAGFRLTRPEPYALG